MSASVIPFPIARRLSFIERQAQVAANMRPEGAERYLRHQLVMQAAAMQRKGISKCLIKRELISMEGAVRASLMAWDGQSDGAC